MDLRCKHPLCRASIIIAVGWAVDIFLSFNLPVVELGRRRLPVMIGAFELKFNTGILKQEVLAQSKIKCKQDPSQHTEDLRSEFG